MEGCDVRSRQHLVLRVIVYSLPWFTPHETAMVESAISRPEERSFLLKAYVGLRTHGFSSLEYTDKNNFAILRWVMKRGIDLRNFQLKVRHNCCLEVYITDRDKVLGELINMEEYGIATYYAQRNDVLDIMHSIYYEEAKTRIHMSTLCLAIYRGSCCQEITEILLKKGADPNLTVEYGWTPLYLASIHAHDPTIVRALLAAGAVQTSNCMEETPLHIACHHGHLEAVVSFIEAGADVTKGDRNGETPLYRAAFHSGEEEVVRALLACEGIDANIRTTKGETPLSMAAYKNFLPAVTLLLAAGADVNTADKNGRTPLYRASYNGASSAVTALLEAGADVTLATDNNWSPLHIASYKGHTAIVTSLLAAAGANSCINQLDRAGGRTPLMLAGSKGHTDIVAALLAAGADVTLANSNGTTALMMASSKGHCGIVEALIQAGAKE